MSNEEKSTEMTPRSALKVLETATAELPMKRKEQLIVLKALDVLLKAISKEN